MAPRSLDVARTAVALVLGCGIVAVGAAVLVVWLGGGDLGWGGRVVGALVALAGLGAVVGWIGARDVSRDVGDLATEIGAMVRSDPEGERGSLHVGSADEVGELVWRFETLRRHFVESLEREKESRRRAEEADRFKTEFMHTVSHELRTPLNSILGFTDVLRKEIDGPLSEAQQEDLAIIRNAGTHLVSLFNDVLDLSAAATGNLALEREAVEPRPLLEAVAQELEGQRGDKAVAIRVEDGDPPPVDADATRLRQIVTNLASNALKFTDEGEVVLGAHDGDDGVRIHVRDTGPGIAREDIERIFEEFGQAERELKRRRGSGLGLAIARQLAELHGGRLEVQSEPGRGSTFTVVLPRWRDAGRAA